jgi:hypothetical protein
MMSSVETKLSLEVSPTPSHGRATRLRSAPWKLAAQAMAAIAKLRILAPYAAIELILPGGSLLALLLWLYRRQKRISDFTVSLNALL